MRPETRSGFDAINYPCRMGEKKFAGMLETYHTFSIVRRSVAGRTDTNYLVRE